MLDILVGDDAVVLGIAQAMLDRAGSHALAALAPVGVVDGDPRWIAAGEGKPAGGCYCCTGSDDFLMALEQVLRGIDSRRRAAPERLIVPVTPEADPAGMIGAVIAHPYLSLRYTPSAVVVLAGAGSSAGGGPPHDAATLVVPTKTAPGDILAHLMVSGPYPAATKSLEVRRRLLRAPFRRGPPRRTGI